MIEVSIIIVNYNVRHFILQCLDSIYRSNYDLTNIEVIVIDNNSIDGSIAAIKETFPQVNIIANSDNKGFGRANNQGIKIAKGKYILLLNPDTILQEDTLDICKNYMLNDDSIGAIGVKMVDGNGTYLKESKRSLPSLWSSFFKITGLNRLFPNTPLFSGYYTRDTSGDVNEKIEVLCGAFMYCHGTLLQQLGGFDEDYFMYGEDIDLSKRIIESGYEIHYISDTRIIHFKGESSKKASFNYIHSFYHAMIIYVDKHFNGGQAVLTKIFLKSAIVITGTIRYLKEAIRSLIRPLLDFVLIFMLFNFTKNWWSVYYFDKVNYYDEADFLVNRLIYSSLWVFNLWFWGWYDQGRKFKSLLFGSMFGTLSILVLYALLPMQYRSSRLLIFIGAALLLALVLLTEWGINYIKRLNAKGNKISKLIIVGYKEDANRIVELLKSQQYEFDLVGTISPDDKMHDSFYLNNISQLEEVVKINKVNEIIFSHNSIPFEKMMDVMVMPDTKVSYKIAGFDNDQIIGSDTSHNKGNILVAYSTYNLSKGVYRRMKRIFDILIILAIVALLPISIFIQKIRVTILPNAITLLLGELTLIGYQDEANNHNLPSLKKGILKLHPSKMPKNYIQYLDKSANIWYARNYSPFYELEI